MSSAAFAQRAAAVKSVSSMVYHGKLVNPQGKAVDGNHSVVIEIFSPEPGLCLLWSEKQNVQIVNGGFALELGFDANRFPGSEGGAARSFSETFVNNPSLTISNAKCAVGDTYVSGTASDRLLYATFENGADKIEVAGLPIKSVPFALQAEQIGGYGLSNLMKISGAGSNVVISPEEAQSLKTLLGGNLLWDMNNRRITKLADPIAADDAATKSWVQSQISATGTLADGSVTTVKIVDQAVTFGKLQNINADKLLGRSSAGPGSAEEISLGAGLSMSAGTLNTVNNGTVTNVSSSNSYLSVANGTSTPYLTLNVGTAANTLAAGDDSRITGALQRSGGTMSGAINMGGFDVNAAGNMNLSADKHLKLGSFASDPNTAGWGAAEKGRAWFNTTSNQVKYWDGSAIQSLGVSGAGLTNLNGMSGGTQTFATGTAGTDFGISSTANTHTFNLPSASGVNRGLLSSADWTAFNNKQPAGAYLTGINSAQVTTALGYTPQAALGFTPQAALGFTPVSNVLSDGQVFVGNASNVAAGRFFGVGDLKTTLGVAQIPASCAASQTMTWSALTDVFSCTNIAGLNASVITAGTLPIGRGGTGSTDGSITGSGALTFAAGGSNQNVVLNPSGIGNTILGGNVGVGTTSPGAKLEVVGQIKITGGSPGAGKVLQSDASGLASWATLGGSESTSVSNIGTAGIGVYKQMTGSNIELKKINAGSAAITITDDAGANEVDVDLANLGVSTAKLADDAVTYSKFQNISADNRLLGRASTGAGNAEEITLGTGLSFSGTTLNVSAGTVTSVAVGGLPLSVVNGSSTPTISIAQANASTAGFISAADWVTFNSRLSSVGGAGLANGNLWVGNGSNVAAAVALSGDVTMTNAGVTTVGKINNTAVTGVGLANNNVLQNNSGSAITGNNVLVSNGTGTGVTALSSPASGVLISTGSIPGWSALSNDNFTQYVLLAGRAGGQNLRGGTAAGDDLTLESTINATKGDVIINPTGGNVGIGTTSPGYRLDVAGNAYFSTGISTNTSVPIRLIENGGASNDAAEIRTGGGELKFYSGRSSSAHQSFVFATGDNFTSGSTRLVINNSGNVGIGTTSPSATLEVNGAAKATAFHTSTFGTATNPALRINTGSGLGLYGSATNLNVAVNGIDSMRFNTALSGVNYLAVSPAATASSPVISTVGADANIDLTISPKGAGNIVFSSGNVGIGTTSPGARLEVAGQIKITGGSPGAGKVLQSDASGLATWTTLGGSESTSVSNIGTAGVGVYKQLTGSNVELKKINAGSSAITITDDTANNELDINLGTVARTSIATGSPNFVLINDGSGALSSEANLSVSRGGTGAATLTANRLLLGNGTSAVQVAAAGTAGQMLQSAGASAPAWSTAVYPATTTINQILFSSAANTISGISTANNSVLTTNGSGVPAWGAISSDVFTQYALLAGRAGGQTLNGGTAASNNLTLDSTSNGTKGNVLINPAGGNVGIGTTSPSSNLDIFGTAPFATTTRSAIGSGQVGFQFRTDSANRAVIFQPPNLNDIHVFTADPVGGSAVRMAIQATTGNVGIGTSSPGAKLHVSGTATNSMRIGSNSTGATNVTNTVMQVVNNIAAFGYDSSSTSSVGAMAHNAYNDGSSSSWSGAFLQHHGTSVAGSTYGFTSANAGQLVFQNVSAGIIASNGANIAISPAGVSNTIFTTSGNVGIGTTSPGQKLSVAGTIESTTGGIRFPDGTTQTTAAAGGGGYNYQSFTTVGTATWTKPGSGNVAYIQCWGGGASGTRYQGYSTYGGGGGGGGGYVERLIPLATLPATVTVTVGAGGAARATNALGLAGSLSSFGSYATAYGGNGGTNGSDSCTNGATFGGIGGGVFPPGSIYNGFPASDFGGAKGGSTIPCCRISRILCHPIS